MPDAELETFKTEINLTEFAASLGFQLIRRETSRNSVAMKHPVTGEKIIIARDNDNHWVFFAVGSPAVSGSIIDFVTGRTGAGSLGGIRKLLRPWVAGMVNDRPAPSLYVAKVEKSTQNRQRIIGQLCAMQPTVDHAYLASRSIGKNILTNPRFTGRVYMDTHGAAIFAHEDDQGTCGYEIKNYGFTGFPPGGSKGLWRSNLEPTDKQLVLCESAIDALSYHALHPDLDARYMSFGGGWSDKTRALIRDAAETHPGPRIILAYDNDDAGHRFEADTRNLLADLSAKTIVTDYPTIGKDWNDQLKGIGPPVPKPASRLVTAGTTITSQRTGSMKLKNSQEKLLEKAVAIRQYNPFDRDELGFSTRVLVQCSLPHTNPGDDLPVWARSNGNLHLSIQPKRYVQDGETVCVGYPYGNIPRLLLLYVCTQAIQAKSPQISLGASMSEFLRSIDLDVTGGRTGTITRLKDQFRRLFTANIDFTYDSGTQTKDIKANLATAIQLWWDAKYPEQASLFDSYVILTQEFFNEIQAHPVPVDLGIVNAIKKSPMALDLYTWLTHRVSYLKKPTPISWQMLGEQLGAEYTNPKELARSTKEALHKIYALWPELKIEEFKGGIKLSPSSRPSVPLLLPGQKK